MNDEILAYHKKLNERDRTICTILADEICDALPDADYKIWHAHPVWFLDGNPIVGYRKLKNCIRLLFWSGQSFKEERLIKSGSFKAAEARFTSTDQINNKEMKQWLEKARQIQWDYKNIVKNKGKLNLIK